MDRSRVCSSCSRGTDEDIIFDLDHYSVVGWGWIQFLVLVILYIYVYLYFSFSLYISLVEVNQAILAW